MKKKTCALLCAWILALGGAAELHARPRGSLGARAAQGGSTGHQVLLSWTASTSAASCTSTSTPPCTFGYNVFRGTAAGAEATTPVNSVLIVGTSYADPTTLTSNPQTFFYFIEAVETTNGVTVASGPSNEVSAGFPGIPSSPTGVVATPK